MLSAAFTLVVFINAAAVVDLFGVEGLMLIVFLMFAPQAVVVLLIVLLPDVYYYADYKRRA